MLMRIRFQRNSRVITKLFSDSSKDNKTEINPPKSNTAEKKLNKEALDKIQSLLDGLKIINEPRDEEKLGFARASGVFKKKKEAFKQSVPKRENVEEKLTKAVGDIAQVIGGDVKQTESELLSKVIDKIILSPTNLSDVISGMKIDNKPEEDVGELKRRTIDEMRRKREATQTSHPSSTRQKRSLMQTRINLFDAEALGIFKPTEPSQVNYGPKMETWDKLEERELRLAMTQPPANYFEKMILWTEQGKVWKFPINNEQGLESEEDVHFSEHVFVDAYLEGWCPKKGPIRHFMELVCVGLSKNPFYTAQEKKDHIMWFKEYFESKKDILKEVGALDDPPESEASTNQS